MIIASRMVGGSDTKACRVSSYSYRAEGFGERADTGVQGGFSVQGSWVG